jgi:hypothetical protein
MRLIFGVLSLLVVLAIVGTVGKKQLQALNSGTASTRNSTAAGQAGIELPPPGSRDGATIAIPGGMPGATAADTSSLTVPQQAANMQQQMRNDVNRALQQGADRNARAAP